MKLIYGLAVLAIVLGVASLLIIDTAPAPEEHTDEDNLVACTADAMQCPDGSFVGRSGPNCEFFCPELVVPADVQAHIDSKAEMIQVYGPLPLNEIGSPLQLSGTAIGPWFFEANAPVLLANWDGEIIAEGYVTAQGEWMTTNFVQFEGTLEFTSPYNAGDPDFMKRGTLIFKKDNPSGLPENDDALEIPIYFIAN